jgi:hypothetical protein
VITEKQIGFTIGYIAAFVVDNFFKVTVIRYGYKTLGWVATKIKITQPAPQVLFERVVDAVRDAY